MTSKKDLYAVIMAGGRDEPVGRRNRPKQMLPLLSDKSMIEETCQRLFPLFAPKNILAVIKSGNGLPVTPLSEKQRIKKLIKKIPDEIL